MSGRTRFFFLTVVSCVMADKIGVSEKQSTTSNTTERLQIKDELPEFPQDWNRLCWKEETLTTFDYLSSLSSEMKEGLLQIKCVIDPMHEALVFSEFREWSNDLDRKVSLDITCPQTSQASEQGKVNLPWPMKARNLVSLSVSRCKILGYFSEYNSAHLLNISDELRVLEIKDAVVLFNVSKLPNLLQNLTGLSSDVDCGQLTLEKFVQKGITFDFDFGFDWDSVSNLMLDNLDKAVENFMTYIDNRPHSCNFTHLRYLEDSSRDAISLHHFHLMTVNSLFPKVVEINFANNGLTEVPSQLQTWPVHFPELQIINISHNHISQFHFSKGYSKPRAFTGDIKVDLSHNNISALSAEDIRYLLSSTTLYVNIKENPITTDCSLILKLNNMLHSQSGLFASVEASKYQYLLTMSETCSQSQKGAVKVTSPRNSVFAYLAIPLGILCVIAIVIVVKLRRVKAARQQAHYSTEKLVYQIA